MPRTRTRTPKPPTTKKTNSKKTAPRTALPVRTRRFMTDIQGHAVLAARIAGITTPRINAWTDHHDGTATRPLKDGTLHYHHPTRTLTWQATCRMGAIHTYLINTPGLAHMARILAARCAQLHHDLTHIEAITADEHAEFAAWAAGEDDARTADQDTGRPTPSWARPQIAGDNEITATISVPLPDWSARALGDTLTRSDTSTADTQALALADIAEEIAARTPDTETPKEHPDHA